MAEWDIRQHVQKDLLTNIHSKVFAMTRPEGSELPCLVYRVVSTPRGEDMEGPTTEHKPRFEIVIYCENTMEGAGFTLKRALVARYHGTEGYDLPGNGTDVLAIEVSGSEVVDEFDGDRFLNTYSDQGAVALTLVVEFDLGAY